MYRGKQLVVAGDHKQLRPNDLYRVRLDKDEDDLALEVDSLLELAAQYLMDVLRSATTIFITTSCECCPIAPW